MALFPIRTERRRSPRYTLAEVVEVYISGTGGEFLGCGVLHDISAIGAGIHLDVSVEPLTEVLVTNEKGTMRGICRSVRSAYTGYIVGIEFTDGGDLSNGCDWSPLPATW